MQTRDHEQADHGGHLADAVGQDGKAEGVALHAADGVHAHRGESHAERGHADPFGDGAAGKADDRREPEQQDRRVFDGPEFQREPRHLRGQRDEEKPADDDPILSLSLDL